MEKQKILVTQSILNNGIEILENAGLEVEIWQEKGPISYEKLLNMASDKVGIISMLSDRIDSKLLENAPHLKVVSNYAVGFNNIDVQAASKLKIAVGNTPGVLTDATADLAMALLLNLSRKIRPASENVKNGEWINWEPMGFLGKSLKGKTLGIYGLGRIGQALAKRCTHGFGMDLIHHTRSEKLMGTKVDFETLLKTSDVLSIHCPLTEETNGLFDYENLSKMKKDSILINTARGEVIVEKDLEKKVNEGHFFGVGLDVTAPEPMSANSSLLKNERVLVTPHIGSADYETRAAMSELVARNIISALNKAELPGFVNPDVWN
ncbi:MAG: D-glycerate dehydrogenase [Halobacteriovorax sp.]|nr:D-glycerate dehydrogenase [Halobacteriovorax sp.]|tara:strand:- start:52908 stop:53873 length:966 start_codon:yes stop_codon:yes gene_type:complete